MINIIYNLPIVGQLTNLENFSGDTSNPIRPFGIIEFANMSSDCEVNIKILEYNLGSGIAQVSVEAEQEFHNNFGVWLEDNIQNAENIVVLEQNELNKIKVPTHVFYIS